MFRLFKNHSLIGAAGQRHSHRLSFDVLEDRLLLSATIVETENNDKKSRANAIVFPVDGVAQLQGVSQGKRDKDFFVFHADASGGIQVDVQTSNGVIAKLRVEDNQGREVFETQPNDGLNSGVFDIVAGRTYYFRLRARGSAPAEYLVDLTLNETGGGGGGGGGGSSFVDEVEPNNSKASATLFQLAHGTSVILRGTSANKDDRDYFRFTPSQNGTLALNVRPTTGPMARLEIETLAGVDVFETQPNDGINSGSVPLIGGTTYTIRLRSPNLSAAAYEVDLSLS